MKKNTMIVVLLAISLIAFSSGLTIIAIMSDENSKLNKVEQIILKDSNALSTSPLYTLNESSANRDNKEAGELITDDNSSDSNMEASQSKDIPGSYSITVKDDTDDSDCNISYEQAVSLGLKSIEKETGIFLSYADVKVSRYNTNESIIWDCLAEDGRYRFEFKVNANSGKFLSYKLYEIDNSSDYVWVSKSKEKVVEKKIDQQNIQEYKSLIIKADSNMNIEVKGGKFFSINAKYYGVDYQLNYKIEDGVMRIEAEGYPDFKDNKTNTLTLTIPEGVVIEAVKVRVDYGNFTMEKVTSDNVDIRLESGRLTMKEVTSKDSTLYIGSGNAELTDYISNKNSIEIAAGSLLMNNCTSEVCKITLDMGETTIKGELSGHTECTSALGSIEIKCTKAEKNYNYTLKTDLGIVSVNGIDGLTKLSANNNAANSINVSTGMGNADIYFK